MSHLHNMSVSIMFLLCFAVVGPVLSDFGSRPDPRGLPPGVGRPDPPGLPPGVGRGPPSLFPFRDPTLPWARRVDDLVRRMTLDELVNQTISIYSAPTYGVPRLGMKPYVWISECLRGQVGFYGTAFPQALGLAAAFSDKLLFEVAEAVSYEVRAHWNNATKSMSGDGFPDAGLSCFSPVINIVRHPLWGRNQETYGEDPYLSSVLARAFVTGLQGSDARYVRASAGCKHFDAHGGPENRPVSRFTFNAKVSTRDWRMTFLPAFKECINAGSYSLMCSYNSINGVPACANGQLLTNITHKEMGFHGYIVSDDGAVDFIRTQHHYTKNDIATAAISVGAGCNLELGSQIFMNIPIAIKKGLLLEELVRERVKPLMYTRMRLGEFDPPSMNPYNAINMSVVQSRAHQMLAIKAAMKSFVLLKNSLYRDTPHETLPLSRKYNKVAIVGPMSDNAEQLYGDYASLVNKTLTVTPWRGLARLAMHAVHASGCVDTPCASYNNSDIKDKVTGSDLVIICLGTGQAVETEGKDRANLDLPGHQLDLLKDAATIGGSSGATVIVLLFNAGPLDVTWAKLSPDVHGMLECFFPAQATGDALYQTLMSKSPDAVPAGRLPVTWPAYLGQVPPMTDYTMKGRTYRYYEGDPLYPFGFGLSYSRFKYSNLTVAPQHVSSGSNVTVSVTVTKTAGFDADEVVQFYMQWPANKNIAPKMQLVGFQRVLIMTTHLVTITVTPRQMAVWVNDSVGFKTLPGTMTIHAGGQQPNQRTSAPSNILKTHFVIV